MGMQPLRRLGVALLGVLAVAGVAGVVSLATVFERPLTVRGFIDVPTTSSPADRPCRVKSDYADISIGTEVVVRNAKGTIVGQGRLGAKREISSPGDVGAGSCRFTFTVSGIEQASSDYYHVKVGGSGEAVYSGHRLRNGGPISLTLGRGS